MIMKLYVGNLHEQISSDALAILFAQAGAVESAQVITTNAGNSRGFGFVAMETREAGAAAISQFNGAEIQGRQIIVNEEEPPKTLAAGASFGCKRSPKENSYVASRTKGWFQS